MACRWLANFRCLSERGNISKYNSVVRPLYDGWDTCVRVLWGCIVYQDCLRELIRPKPDWGPALPKFRTGRYSPDWERNGGIWYSAAVAPKFTNLERVNAQSNVTLESFASTPLWQLSVVSSVRMLILRTYVVPVPLLANKDYHRGGQLKQYCSSCIFIFAKVTWYCDIV